MKTPTRRFKYSIVDTRRFVSGETFADSEAHAVQQVVAIADNLRFHEPRINVCEDVRCWQSLS